MSNKTIDQYFIDWESHVFGFGYGTGEPYTITALKTFMDNIGRDDLPNAYDYEKLEVILGNTVAWLLINILCHAGIIEYGSSPRYGWLDPTGERLREYINTKTSTELIDLCCDRTEDYISCYPDHCNCDEPKCSNPFWTSHVSQ